MCIYQKVESVSFSQKKDPSVYSFINSYPQLVLSTYKFFTALSLSVYARASTRIIFGSNTWQCSTSLSICHRILNILTRLGEAFAQKELAQRLLLYFADTFDASGTIESLEIKILHLMFVADTISWTGLLLDKNRFQLSNDMEDIGITSSRSAGGFKYPNTKMIENTHSVQSPKRETKISELLKDSSTLLCIGMEMNKFTG